MRIDKTNKILKVYNNMEFDRLRKKAGRQEKDSLKLSDQAKDYQFALEKLKEVPDIRMDKVEKLKKEIQAGTYDIDGRKIVEKIYQSINLDEKA